MLHSRKRAQAMEEALKWYADMENWMQTRNERGEVIVHSYADMDCGNRARAALSVDPWDSCPVGRSYDDAESVVAEGCQR